MAKNGGKLINGFSYVGDNDMIVEVVRCWWNTHYVADFFLILLTF